MSDKIEYLFRVKQYADVYNEENPYEDGWVYADARTDYDFFYGMSDGQYDSGTLGMWSGLMDCKGKLMYEGDVVQHDGREDSYLGVVKFSKGRFFVTYEVNDFIDVNIFELSPHVQVVGNIYEGEYKKFKDIPEMISL